MYQRAAFILGNVLRISLKSWKKRNDLQKMKTIENRLQNFGENAARKSTKYTKKAKSAYIYIVVEMSRAFIARLFSAIQ